MKNRLGKCLLVTYHRSTDKKLFNRGSNDKTLEESSAGKEEWIACVDSAVKDKLRCCLMPKDCPPKAAKEWFCVI